MFITETALWTTAPTQSCGVAEAVKLSFSQAIKVATKQELYRTLRLLFTISQT